MYVPKYLGMKCHNACNLFSVGPEKEQNEINLVIMVGESSCECMSVLCTILSASL